MAAGIPALSDNPNFPFKDNDTETSFLGVSCVPNYGGENLGTFLNPH